VYNHIFTWTARLSDGGGMGARVQGFSGMWARAHGFSEIEKRVFGFRKMKIASMALFSLQSTTIRHASWLQLFEYENPSPRPSLSRGFFIVLFMFVSEGEVLILVNIEMLRIASR